MFFMIANCVLWHCPAPITNNSDCFGPSEISALAVCFEKDTAGSGQREPPQTCL